MRHVLCGCLLLAGCGRVTPPAGGTPPPEAEVGPAGLYPDAEIRALAPYDIDRETRAAKSILDMPWLDVVPAGETRPRGVVFQALGLDDRRLRDFRHRGAGKAEFLMWQVSPSYDIVCMTGSNDFLDEGVDYPDPKRKVYGIRLVTRGVGLRP